MSLRKPQELNDFYPLSTLADLPSFPPPEYARELYPTFVNAFQGQLFYDSVASMDTRIPYLTYACGCLAMVSLQNDSGKNGMATFNGPAPTKHSASEYFWVGTKILTLILEIDNREARIIETAVAVCSKVCQMSSTRLTPD